MKDPQQYPTLAGDFDRLYLEYPDVYHRFALHDVQATAALAELSDLQDKIIADGRAGRHSGIRGIQALLGAFRRKDDDPHLAPLLDQAIASDIPVLKEGRLIEEGVHDELIVVDAFFATMFNLHAERYT